MHEACAYDGAAENAECYDERRRTAADLHEESGRLLHPSAIRASLGLVSGHCDMRACSNDAQSPSNESRWNSPPPEREQAVKLHTQRQVWGGGNIIEFGIF